MKTVLENYKPIEKAHKKFDAFTADDHLIDLYQARERQLYQYQTDLQFEHEKGKNEGKIEGKVETAQNLKTMGIPIDQIFKATGLSIEGIEKL